MFKESQKHPLDVLDKPKKPKPPPVQQEYIDDNWTWKQWAAYLKSVWDNPNYSNMGFGQFPYEQHEQAAQDALRSTRPKTNYPSKSRSRPNWFTRNIRKSK